MNIVDEYPFVTQVASDKWKPSLQKFVSKVSYWNSLTEWEQQVELWLTPKHFREYIPYAFEPSSKNFGRTLYNDEGSRITLFHPTNHRKKEAYAYEYEQYNDIEIPWYNKFAYPDYCLENLELDWEYSEEMLNRLITRARLLHSQITDHVFFFFFD